MVQTTQIDMEDLEFTLCVCKIKLSELGLPTSVCHYILDPLVAAVRTCLRQEKQRQNAPFNGVSRSSAKRRAKYLDRCIKCGKFSHTGPCPRNQTISNAEIVHLIYNGTTRFLAEKPQYRRGSFAQMLADRLLERSNLSL
ncbi:nucleic acid binding protein [Coleus vein necrosis virus]|uniref:Nucleic acid binding protein n=1 Tax=Coleus vein necrosis virus TaxID=404404 RepID=A7TZS2_9VIRU|nr:nucleic acid binding protein [Coleus vein necrosis virus]ABS89250.1 nucleic acid binding protein [Coleus vein necrosis virus]